MSRPQSTTSARVTHCHKTICNQYTFRNLSIRTEQVSKVHTTTRLTHSMMCSHLFLVLFHFLYLGIDSSSNGSICSRMYDIAWALFIIRSIYIYVYVGIIWSLVLIGHLYLSGKYIWEGLWLKSGHQKDLCSDEKFWIVCSKYYIDTTLHSQLGGPMGFIQRERESASLWPLMDFASQLFFIF